MSDYNIIKVGDIWFTDTGLEDGQPCRVDAQGLTRLRMSNRRTAVLPISGAPFMQYFDQIGEQFSLQVFAMTTAAFELLVAELDAAEISGEPLNVTISGDTGEFDLDCVVTNFDQPGSFSNGIIPAVSMEFRISAFNEIVEEE